MPSDEVGGVGSGIFLALSIVTAEMQKRKTIGAGLSQLNDAIDDELMSRRDFQRGSYGLKHRLQARI